MKLVDEKGKLFGKFNLVDFIVILLVVCIVAAVIWKVADAKITASQEAAELDASSFENAPHLTFSVVCRDVLPEVAEACAAERPQEEQQIMNGSDPVEAFITDCTYTAQQDPNGQDTGLCQVTFTMEASINEKDGIYKVGTQEIRIGKSYIVKTYNIELSGTIIAMEAVDE